MDSVPIYLIPSAWSLATARPLSNKAGFPNVGTLTIYGLVDEPFDVKKLGAGRSRDTYIVNEEVIVKIEVQAPPGSANTAEVIS